MLLLVPRNCGENALNFLQDCLFCGHGCRVSHPLKNPGRWRAAYLCRTTDDRKTTSKEAIYETNGACGREVAFQANLAVSDLHAACQVSQRLLS